MMPADSWLSISCMWVTYAMACSKTAICIICSASARAAPLLNIPTLGKIAVCNLGVFGTQ